MKSINFNYLARIDHLRFYAALVVIFHHFRGVNFSLNVTNLSHNTISGIFHLWLNNGSTGVSLFLVLSAFLFTLITHAGNKELIYSNFIYNRILRIFPLTTLLVFIVITCSRGNSTPMDILRLFTLQLNTGNNMTGWGHNYFPSGTIWTVAVEFQFYLLFPLMILFTKKFGIRYLFGIISLFLILRGILIVLNSPNIYYNLYHTIIGRMDQFCIGILLGIFYIKKEMLLTKNQCLIGIYSCLTLLTIIFFYSQNVSLFKGTIYFPIEAILWGGVIIFYLSYPLNNRFNFLSKLFSFLGSLSFSIYLLHLPIGIAVTHILKLNEPNTIIQSIEHTLIRIGFIIPISILSFYTIEKPFLSLRTRYFKESSLKPSANALH